MSEKIGFFRSFRSRLLVVLILAPVITLIFFLFIGYKTIVAQQEAQMQSYLLDTTAYYASLIRERIQSTEQSLDQAAKEILRTEFIGESVVFNTSNDFSYFQIYDTKNNQIKYSRTNPDFQIDLTNALNEFVDSSVVFLTDKGLRYLVIRKMLANTQYKAIGIFNIQESFFTQSKNRVRFKFLLTGRGRIIDGSNPDLTSDQVYKLQAQMNSQIKQNADGVFEFTAERGQKFLVGFSRIIDSLDHVITLVPETAIRAQHGFIFTNLIIISVAVMSLILLIGIYFSRNMSSSIGKLVTSTQKVSQGDLDVIVSIPGADEFSDLATKFNDMTRRVRTLVGESVRKARLEGELETAKLIQAKLLPKSEYQDQFCEISTFFKAATKVGGDWWSVAPRKDSVGIYVGDAVGHGPAAGLVTSAARVAMETVEQMSSSSLVNRVAKFDELLTKSFDGGVVMTLFIGDLVGRVFEYYIAAHEPGIWLRSNGETNLLDMDTPTAQVGRGDGVRSKSKVVQFEKGDYVILYTDGILEIKDELNRELGLKRFIRLIEECHAPGISTHDLRARILKKLIPRLNAHEQGDDILMMIIRIK